MKKIIYITGGAKSGKSDHALKLSEAVQGSKVYIATAEALDDEMVLRIKKHQRERGADWSTLEEPVKLALALASASREHKVVLIDCLTLWISNLMGTGADIEAELMGLSQALKESREHADIVLVSNEVGMGIVPSNEMAREFRDIAGRVNQMVAGMADEAYLSISGILMQIK